MSNLDAVSVSDWYYEANGEKKGPIAEPEIVNMVNAGILTHGSSVWQKGFTEWVNIEKSKFNEYLGAPPLTGTSVKNGMVWTLAFAPAIGQLCEGFVGSIIGMQYFEKLWFITVLLNIR